MPRVIWGSGRVLQECSQSGEDLVFESEMPNMQPTTSTFPPPHYTTLPLITSHKHPISPPTQLQHLLPLLTTLQTHYIIHPYICHHFTVQIPTGWRTRDSGHQRWVKPHTPECCLHSISASYTLHHTCIVGAVKLCTIGLTTQTCSSLTQQYTSHCETQQCASTGGTVRGLLTANQNFYFLPPLQHCHTDNRTVAIHSAMFVSLQQLGES